MKTKILYWAPSVGISAAILGLLAAAAFVIALGYSSIAHADDGIAAAGGVSTVTATPTPAGVPTDPAAMLTEGEGAVQAFASKDYLYATGLILFLLIGAYEKFFTNAVPAKDRIFVTLLLPAAIAFAGAAVVHSSLLVCGEAAGSALGAAFMAEGGLALLPALKAAVGIGVAPKPAGS